jgi:calcium-dependent protein kinase
MHVEIEVLKKLDHPNILKIFEIYENDENFYIVSELCQGGELYDLINHKKKFSE